MWCMGTKYLDIHYKNTPRFFFLTYYLLYILQFNQKMLINLWRFILEVVHLRLAHKYGVGDSRAPFVFGIALVLT